MKILFAAVEVFPFAKVGGLADIMHSLPPALKAPGVEVAVIMPKHFVIPEEYRSRMNHVTQFDMSLGWQTVYCGLEELYLDGIQYYFIDNEYYFYRDKVYGYPDDGERFAYFSKAVLECIRMYPDMMPQVLHCNDWHTALIPLYLTELYWQNPILSTMRTVLTIHNLRHQGRFSLDCYDSLLGLGECQYAWNKLEYHNCLNFMKGGILSADCVSTVSPTYAQEIKEDFFGEGLNTVICSKGEAVWGILNGIPDVKLPFCKKTAQETTIMPKKLEGFKQEHKQRLQEELNLPIRPEVMLAAIVTRLDRQKGIELLEPILDELLQGDIQIIVLGSGEKEYEDLFRDFAYRYPNKLGLSLGYNETLADTLYKGADVLFMPSLFEPCGLSQMLAMRYGTLPIVRETGGLQDTVIAYNEFTGEGTGFSFRPYDAYEFLHVINYAAYVFWNDKKAWESIRRQAAAADFSWKASAGKYRELYESILHPEEKEGK
ncbi:MAG: glycogen synthase [Lachnospiraceae bacterium]